MKFSVKTLVLLTIFIVCLTTVHAQIRLNTNPSISADLRKVIEDYPSHFEHILGDPVVSNPQSTDFHCRVTIPGAVECVITRFSSNDTPVVSWQAVMLHTSGFEEAKRRFRSLFTDLNNLRAGSTMLKGVYEAPVEEKQFNSVLFSPVPADGAYRRLRLELVMEAQGMDWKVRLLIYDSEA